MLPKSKRASTRSSRSASAGPQRRAPKGPAKTGRPTARPPVEEEVRSALGWLERHGTRSTRDRIASYGIAVTRAFGVSMADIQALAERLGRSHELAAALWDSGWYEARLLAAFVDEPERVTPAQMDRWSRDFDNWGICDTVCFVLFDRTPHAWTKIAAWSDARAEFVKRAAFALLASLAGHDKTTGDAPFLDGLRRVERAAGDERNLVKKGVRWALRRIGRRNAALHAAALATARRLAVSPEAAARWVGTAALRDLTGPVVARQLAARGRGGKKRKPAATR